MNLGKSELFLGSRTKRVSGLLIVHGTFDIPNSCRTYCKVRKLWKTAVYKVHADVFAYFIIPRSFYGLGSLPLSPKRYFLYIRSAPLRGRRGRRREREEHWPVVFTKRSWNANVIYSYSFHIVSFVYLRK